MYMCINVCVCVCVCVSKHLSRDGTRFPCMFSTKQIRRFAPWDPWSDSMTNGFGFTSMADLGFSSFLFCWCVFVLFSLASSPRAGRRISKSAADRLCMRNLWKSNNNNNNNNSNNQTPLLLLEKEKKKADSSSPRNLRHARRRSH